MNVENISLLKNFQTIISSYQDVSAIYTKLFSQGQLQKLTSLVSDIYDEEHVFTLTELQKYCQENNQKEDNFVAEQYELNANIFRRNLTLIVQTIVEEIGRKSVERFRQDYANGTSEEVSFKQAQNNEQSSQETISEKAYYRSNMPEIQEEAEGNSRPVTTKATPKSGTESDKLLSNKSFDLNINDLAQRAQPQQEENSNLLSRPLAPQHISRAKSFDKTEIKTHHKELSLNVEREDNQKQSSPYYKTETSGFAYSEPTRADEYSHYDHESGTFRVNQQTKFLGTPQTRNSQNSVNQWSSSERTANHGRKGAQSTNQRGTKPFSPERGTVYEKRSPSGLTNSFSRWSSSNDRPDPSILDSEFSYGQGNSFSKSPKKFHHNIKNIPGPGDYELDESEQATRAKSPDLSFSKTPKTPAYFQVSKVPGAIYYPVKHFLSK